MSVDLLFRGFDLNGLKLNNRVVMAPMTRQFSPGNVANSKVAAYYRRRAEGGVGLIITEGTCIGHPASSGYDNVPYIYGDTALDGWSKVVEEVHAAGGVIFPQLWHVGSIRKEGMEPDPSVPAYSPSGLYKPNRQNGKAMTDSDIADCIDAFAQAAEDARRVGFDGVEIHGAHGYLVDQFFWTGTNQRDDHYGGELEARTRFAVECIRAIRQRVGHEFPLSLRFSQWKLQDYEARLADNPEQLASFLEPLVDAGVDIFHCSTRRYWVPEFDGSGLNLAGWTKKLTGKPTMTVGSVGLDDDFIQQQVDGFHASSPAALEPLLERLANDEFDLVAVGRALIANPDWPNKVRDARSGELQSYSKKALAELV